MTMKFFDLFFNAMRLQNHIDHARFATDPDYPQTLIRELCGEPESALASSTDSVGGVTGKSDRLAA